MIQRLIGAGLLLLGLAACSAPPSNEHTLTETDFAYGPPSIAVPLGETVTLTFVNNGTVEHDFVVESIDVSGVMSETAGEHQHEMGDAEYDLHVSTLPGQTSVLSFVPNVPGTYEFICTVKGHKEAGMIGTMTVVTE